MDGSNNPTNESMQAAFEILATEVRNKTDVFMAGGSHSDIREYMSCLRLMLKDFMIRVTKPNCPPPSIGHLFGFLERERYRLRFAGDTNFAAMQHAIIDIHQSMSMTHQIEQTRRSIPSTQPGMYGIPATGYNDMRFVNRGVEPGHNDGRMEAPYFIQNGVSRLGNVTPNRMQGYTYHAPIPSN